MSPEARRTGPGGQMRLLSMSFVRISATPFSSGASGSSRASASLSVARAPSSSSVIKELASTSASRPFLRNSSMSAIAVTLTSRQTWRTFSFIFSVVFDFAGPIDCKSRRRLRKVSSDLDVEEAEWLSKLGCAAVTRKSLAPVRAPDVRMLPHQREKMINEFVQFAMRALRLKVNGRPKKLSEEQQSQPNVDHDVVLLHFHLCIRAVFLPRPHHILVIPHSSPSRLGSPLVVLSLLCRSSREEHFRRIRPHEVQDGVHSERMTHRLVSGRDVSHERAVPKHFAVDFAPRPISALSRRQEIEELVRDVPNEQDRPAVLFERFQRHGPGGFEPA
mmetsp:Transcript_27873/g.85523  ORF Transcript_27873/g.85523 Transcript_27873/m.85523 type:complete len:332 (+) Transcript_27873:734-1729(+)